MIKFTELEADLKKGKIENSYIFYGFNEKLMRENTEFICKKVLSKDFKTLNLVKFDGNTVNAEDIINACETLPFMSEKRVVLVAKAVFLEEKGKQVGVNAEETCNKLYDYMDKIPPYTILILNYAFTDKREKPSKRLLKLSKKCTAVEFNKITGVQLQKRIKEIFQEKGKNIGNAELNQFCLLVENNLDIIANEIEKLCCYTIDREITRKDIIDCIYTKSDNDIFNLVDFISQRNPQKAINVLDELLFRGEKSNIILNMIERQLRLLLIIKYDMQNGMSKDEIVKKNALNPFICEKMMAQSKGFTTEMLTKALKLCLDCEKNMKSATSSKSIEIEMLLVKMAI